MPVDRTNKTHTCNYPDCDKTFRRPYDLDRHLITHGVYEERPFGCPYVDCGFRANQAGGLKCHINSIHENVRLLCGTPGCDKTFSDPSSRSKHLKRYHSDNPEASGSKPSQVRKKKHSAVPARVARHVEEHSRQDAKDILNQFATFAIHSTGSSNPATPSSNDAPSNSGTRRSASHGASSAPSSSVFRLDTTIRPSPCELPGVLQRANDVLSDGWSIDNEYQKKHQAYNANPRAAPTAWGYYPDAPVLSRPQVPTFDQASRARSVQGDVDLTEASRDQFCKCSICNRLRAPLRGQQEEVRAEVVTLPLPFSYAGSSHVPPSDHQWVHPPDIPSSAYFRRPNPRMLFDIR